MKKIINKISKYIIGVWAVVFVLLLACVLNEDKLTANDILMPVFILFFVVTIAILLTCVIHLIWMIKAKRKPQNLKGDIISGVTILLLLTIYDVYSNQFEWSDFWKKIVLVMLILISSEIGRYIYSWKE